MASKAETLADLLRSAIRAGVHQPGDTLPTLIELAAEANIAKGTAAQAIKLLVREGLLKTSPGTGIQVVGFRRYPWPLETGRTLVPGSDPWAAEVRSQGREPSETVEVLREYASEAVAEALGTGTNDLLVVRRRRRFVDGRPVQVSTSYFASALAAGTRFESPETIQVAGGVLADIGRPQDRITVDVVGDMPTTEERHMFGDLAKGIPAFYVTHHGFDRDGLPLRLMKTIAPCDRNTLTLVMEGLA